MMVWSGKGIDSEAGYLHKRNDFEGKVRMTLESAL